MDVKVMPPTVFSCYNRMPLSYILEHLSAITLHESVPQFIQQQYCSLMFTDLKNEINTFGNNTECIKLPLIDFVANPSAHMYLHATLFTAARDPWNLMFQNSDCDSLGKQNHKFLCENKKMMVALYEVHCTSLAVIITNCHSLHLHTVQCFDKLTCIIQQVTLYVGAHRYSRCEMDAEAPGRQVELLQMKLFTVNQRSAQTFLYILYRSVGVQLIKYGGLHSGD